jgi:hypothetical protein
MGKVMELRGLSEVMIVNRRFWREKGVVARCCVDEQLHVSCLTKG